MAQEKWWECVDWRMKELPASVECPMLQRLSRLHRALRCAHAPVLYHQLHAQPFDAFAEAVLRAGRGAISAMEIPSVPEGFPSMEDRRFCCAMGTLAVLQLDGSLEPPQTEISAAASQLLVAREMANSLEEGSASLPALIFTHVAASPLEAIVAIVFPTEEQRAAVRLVRDGLVAYDSRLHGRLTCIAERVAPFHAQGLYNRMPLPTDVALYPAVRQLQASFETRKASLRPPRRSIE
jgi:hypothetical protein